LTLLSALQLVPVPTPALRVVSPNTLETNLRLRPAVEERLPGEEGGIDSRPTSFAVSLSPPDTRDFFSQLFPLTLLYAAARSNLTGNRPLVRLAWVCAINGALLCFLGIAQRVSSPTNMVYWSIATAGQVFGPFVNRNHLPYYTNICLGLGCALLSRRLRDGLSDAISRPTVLWLLLLIGVTTVGQLFSQSRGGLVAGMAAAAVCLLVWFRQSRRATGLGWVLWGVLVVAVAGSWVGWAPMTARLGTLDESQLTDDRRTGLWLEGLGVFTRYPFLGTGSGTYTWVEPTVRTKTGGENVSAEYAHNEYVEALVEGGIVRFALTLLLVFGPILRVVGRANAARRSLRYPGGRATKLRGLRRPHAGGRRSGSRPFGLFDGSM
jgi:O-antigen ligase